MAQIRQQDCKVPLILITKHSSESRVIAALRAGCNDYFKVPFSYDDLIASVKRHLFYSSLPSLINRKILSPLGSGQPMIGDSMPMQKIRSYLRTVAATDSPVLITGETGTGKELAAEWIHQNSSRHKKPLVCINCAALPETLVESELFGYERGAFTGAVALSRGKFELAAGGSVLLDEIGDMSAYAQAKILRTVERKDAYRLGGKSRIPLNVRVIAATNQDPDRLVTEGKFRKDLYFRLNVARVHLPALRDRKEDIFALLEHLIRAFNRRFDRKVKGFTEEALQTLLCYDWPGNVRELKNILEAAFISLPSPHVIFMDLPQSLQERFKETDGGPKRERDQVLSALTAAHWNKSKAAQKLHWSRMTLYRKMAKYQIVDHISPQR